MSGFLPKFVLPSDVRDLKIRLDPVVRSLDASAAQCATLDPATRTSWADFSRAWRAYFDEEDSWLHTAAQMDAGESYERQIADWQRLLATPCTLHVPQITPSTTPPATSQDTIQDTIRTVAIAGAVIAVVVGIRSVMR